MAKRHIIFLDTETTGTEENDRLCQLAARGVHFEDGAVFEEINELYKPPLPISIGAMSVCHITNEMVEDKEPFQESVAHEWLKNASGYEDIVIVAHNARFDLEMLKKEGIEPKHHICTMKVANHINQKGDFEKVNLQYLRYYYGIKVEATAHDAMGDVVVLELVFKKLYDALAELEQLEDQEAVISRMIDISSKPSLIRKMPFGKHKGMLMQEVPGDYIQWLKKQPDLDEDMAYTLKTLEEQLPW